MGLLGCAWEAGGLEVRRLGFSVLYLAPLLGQGAAQTFLPLSRPQQLVLFLVYSITVHEFHILVESSFLLKEFRIHKTGSLNSNSIAP